MAQSFNEKGPIDLKIWKGKYILHIVDTYVEQTYHFSFNQKEEVQGCDWQADGEVGFLFWGDEGNTE